MYYTQLNNGAEDAAGKRGLEERADSIVVAYGVVVVVVMREEATMCQMMVCVAMCL